MSIPASGSLERVAEGYDAAIAADGGHIVYLSPTLDVLVCELATGSASPVTSAAPPNFASYWPSISADGRYVAYHSYKPNLIAGDTNQTVDVFTTDRATGTTLRIGDRDSYPAISGDGRFVAYGLDHVSYWDRTTGASIQMPNGHGPRAAVSGSGRYVAYQSAASELVVWDSTTGTTTQVTNGNGASSSPTISGDGRYITYESFASDLVTGDDNARGDVFLWDSATRTNTRLTDGNDNSFNPTISSDGDLVTFTSHASDLVPDEGYGTTDVFLWRRSAG